MFKNPFSESVFKQKYAFTNDETWPQACRRVVDAVCGKLPGYAQQDIYEAMVDRKFIPGGRYLYASGRDWQQFNNCFLFRAEDSSDGWARMMFRGTAALMSGGGIGSVYSGLRPRGASIKRKGGFSTGPISHMHMMNEAGRHIMQGGQRRSAIWAGLHWWHQDIEDFMVLKNWSPDLVAMKQKDYTFALPMELTNISVIYGTDFFRAVDNPDDPMHKRALDVWHKNCLQAFQTAEPGMSFNYLKDGEDLRNACTEVTSEDDSDKCNLGTVWMNRCATIDEFNRVVRLGTLFLMCGGQISDLPTKKIRKVGDLNNRIGLGIGGMHEWLMQRRQPYVVTEEMHQWLYWYVQGSEEVASVWSKKLGVAYPKGIRAIAPTGSIGILAETTTGIEPLFCKAYKRRYFKDGQWHVQYVVDGTVKTLLAQGLSTDEIHDSNDLSFEDRVTFQADVQKYVDMAISSTCNLPAWGSPSNNETTLVDHSRTLLKHARMLRGFTVYPDGARTGQPLERVTLDEALALEGQVMIENSNICDLTKGGSCGS